MVLKALSPDVLGRSYLVCILVTDRYKRMMIFDGNDWAIAKMFSSCEEMGQGAVHV